ncbi:hypothetical protein EDD86DRAFT_200935 [Gorgonomyces haynaldii]|nr:hypothetical protein EDD86DRAFT_200935 [Gorgonomyces haynaldii]
MLEATVIAIDNSEWMRNGDYTPSRLEAQNDAVTTIFHVKTSDNPENTVGLLTMAGKSPSVLTTLTSDIGKILTSLHHVSVNGQSNFTTGVQIAQLVLKHRQNKSQRPRVIVFVGSPIPEDEKALVKLGKKLKKNGVAVDVVNFGQEEENTAKLQAFIEAVNSSDNSHLVSVPPGNHILSDMILSSPILAGENGAPAGFSSGGGFEFGVDPTLDPELAMALRMSMEEERARQEKLQGPSKQLSPEDEELQRALNMSMGGDVEMTTAEDEEMQRALAMSMGDNVDLNAVLGQLPGVNTQDPRIQSAMDEDKKRKKEDDTKK